MDNVGRTGKQTTSIPKSGSDKSYFISESLRLNLFWLRIMMEHALFIRLGLPCENTALRSEAQQLENEFGRLLEEARKVEKHPSESKVTELNREAIALTTAIIDFKSRVLKLIICCNITTGFNLPLLIDHIRREAIFFRVALVRLQEQITVNPVEQLLQEEVFWLRQMSDHSKFIAHLLDPSERRFVKTAQDFSRRLDEEKQHAQDFNSMLVPQAFENSLLDDTKPITIRPIALGEGLPKPFSLPSLERFTDQDALPTIAELRDFKLAARDLITNCAILSIIPPLLADHVLREADRALEDIDLQLRKLPAPCRQDAGCTRSQTDHDSIQKNNGDAVKRSWWKGDSSLFAKSKPKVNIGYPSSR